MYYDDEVSALENITGSIKVFRVIFTFIIFGCVVIIAFRILGNAFTFMGNVKLGLTLISLSNLVPVKTLTAVFTIFVLYLASKITVIIEGFAKLQSPNYIASSKLQSPNYIAGSRDGRKEPTL